MNEQEFMHFIAMKLFSKRQFENPFYIRMQPRGYGKTESRRIHLKKIAEENLKIFNESNYSIESITVMIGKIKLKIVRRCKK